MSFIDTFIAPLEIDTFLSDLKNNRPFVIPGSAEKIERLFSGPMGEREVLRMLVRAESLQGFEPVISCFPTSFLIEGFEESPVPQIPISPRAAREIIASGTNTALNITKLHQIDERLLRCLTGLKSALGLIGDADTVCFHHPPSGHGIHLHFDHCFVFQVLFSGTKHWRISLKPHEPWPRSSERARRDGKVELTGAGWERTLVSQDDIELVDFETNPGDILFIPAGCWHTTRSVAGGSLGLTFSFYPASFRELLGHALLDHFEPETAWRAPVPFGASRRSRSTTTDKETAQFFAERLHELRKFVAELEPDGPELTRARQKALAKAPSYLAPDLRPPPLADGGPLRVDEVLSLPIDAPVTGAEDMAGGAPMLYLYYDTHEVCFDDPKYIPFARALLGQTSFVAGDARNWSQPGTSPYEWEELVPLFESLVADGFLRRADK